MDKHRNDDRVFDANGSLVTRSDPFYWHERDLDRAQRAWEARVAAMKSPIREQYLAMDAAAKQLSLYYALNAISPRAKRAIWETVKLWRLAEQEETTSEVAVALNRKTEAEVERMRRDDAARAVLAHVASAQGITPDTPEGRAALDQWIDAQTDEQLSELYLRERRRC